MLRFDSYAAQASETAIYPSQFALAYLSLGLADELGEVRSAVLLSKALRTEDSLLPIEKEMGDVYWYLGQLARELGLTGEVSWHRCGAYNQFTFPHYDQALVDIDEAIQAAIEIAGFIKKAIRDDGGDPSPERIRQVAGCMEVICVMTGEALSLLQLPEPDEVAATNLDKVLGRKERGVLQGDGDDR